MWTTSDMHWCPRMIERPEMIKYHVSYLLSFHFLPPAHYRPDSLSGFYRADDSGPPSGYHPLQLSIMTKQSHSLFFFFSLLHPPSLITILASGAGEPPATKI